jgi:hypothetical protein
MEPLIVIMLPGLVGGLVLAFIIGRFAGATQERESIQARLEQPSTNVINMARIRVAGVGGLGMVAMAVTVAIFVPRIRSTMALALALGVAMAIALIALRRREGPLSSSNGPGAHSMFPLDEPPAAAPATDLSSVCDPKQEFAPGAA